MKSALLVLTGLMMLPGCGYRLAFPDRDGDGVPASEDCDDSSLDVRARKVWYADADGDGFGNPEEYVLSCFPAPMHTDIAKDCDDHNASINPNGIERCASPADDDCDGATNEPDLPDCTTFYIDEDGDGVGGEITGCFCEPAGLYSAELPGDCDDTNADTSPFAPEICSDGTDSDCDALDCVWGLTSLLPEQTDYQLDGLTSSDHVGGALAMGDVTRDGFSDLLVGAPGAGVAYLVTSVERTQQSVSDAAVEFVGESDDDETGFSVSVVGDFNADGFVDIAIGAPGRDTGGEDRGAAFLIFGPVDVQSRVDLTASRMRMVGSFDGERLGHAMSAAGDVNGDGRADLLIGAPGNGDVLEGGGAAFLFYGSAPQGTVLSQEANALIYGATRNAAVGAAVAGAGDLDGDGNDDFVIGAPNTDSADGSLDAVGAVYWFYGPVAGPLSVSDADAYATGGQEDELAGAALAGAGDVNGDGRPDVLVGAPGRNNNAGAAWLVLGPGPSTPDLDGAEAGVTGLANDDLAGASVAGVGDLDNDGFADFAVGSPGRGDENGGAWIFRGPMSGIVGLSSAALGVTGVDGEGVGYAIAGGDTNGDAFSDVAIGLPFSDAGGSSSGQALVLFGEPSP